MLAALGVSVVSIALKNLFPEWHDPELLINLTPVLAGVLGYVVKDAPNS